MRRLQLVGVVGLGLTGLLLACGGGGGETSVITSRDIGEPQIITSAVPQSFPIDQPISVAMVPTGNIPIKISQGQTLTLTVEATGAMPLLYQWRHKGNAISGATAARYQIKEIMPGEQEGDYTVSIANSVGFAGSSQAIVKVIPK